MDDLTLRREFARKVRDALEHKGWSQTDLAKRTGITQSTISDIIRRRGPHEDPPALPNTMRLLRICHALGYSADWLLGLTSNPHGGAATAGQVFQDGGMRALAEVHEEIQRIESRWRGEASAAMLPSADERAAAAEHLELARELARTPGLRRKPRRKRA